MKAYKKAAAEKEAACWAAVEQEAAKNAAAERTAAMVADRAAGTKEATPDKKGERWQKKGTRAAGKKQTEEPANAEAAAAEKKTAKQVAAPNT